jgi:hypothetical protein
MDVSTAFLVPALKEEIYLRLPEQSTINEVLPEFATKDVVRLNKCLYGLVQSPRYFYMHFSEVLKKLQLTQSAMDPCLWLKFDGNTIIAAIAIFVDDCAISGFEHEVISLKKQLQDHFDMTDGGAISWFLGVSIENNLKSGTIHLSQKAMITDLLRRFNMSDCSPVSTPIETRLTHSPGQIGEEERLFMQNKDYRGLVGSLLYLYFTRPDVAFAVNQLSRHVNDPRRVHWNAAMRVLRYLRGTTDLGLKYTRENPSKVPVIGFSDSDWGGDTDSRRSTTGYVFLMSGAAISFKTKLQASVALSTCEAELVALSEATREAIWLRQLLIEMKQMTNDRPVPLMEDNQAALQLVRDQRFSERTKHVAIRHFFVREESAEGTVTVEYCPTAHMVADIFTKPLSRIVFERLRVALGLHPIRSTPDEEES